MIKIAKTSHVPIGRGLCVDLPDGRSIALFNLNGTFHAIDNFCPHKGAPLNEGKLEGSCVVCPWHCWKFDITTGACPDKDGVRVKSYALTIQNDNIYM